MAISLRIVNSKNYSAIVKLDAGPNAYVAPNVKTLAWSAYKYNKCVILRAIYLDGIPIGLIFSHVYKRSNYKTIKRFIEVMMIDKQYQGKGYGASALKKFITLVKRLDKKYDEIYTGYEIDNKRAGDFYKRLGFEQAPKAEDNILVYRY